MEILQSIEHAEAWAGIEMKSGVADRGKVHQDRLTVALLKRDGGIDRKCCGAASTLGIDDREDTSLAAAASLAARGRIAREGFQQSLGSRHAVDKFASTGAHGADDGHGVAHLADGKDRD